MIALASGWAASAWPLGLKFAAAQQVGEPGCLSTVPSELPIDSRLSFPANFQPAVSTDVSATGSRLDEVRVDWPATFGEAGGRCVWIGYAPKGEAIGQFGDRLARVNDASVRLSVAGAPGEYCFRLVAMAPAKIGAAKEFCLVFANTAGPRAPSTQPDAPAPPDTGQGFVTGEGGIPTWAGGLIVVAGSVLAAALLSSGRRRG
ncbi:MAG: hypothetical protein ACR2HN_12730 [Tepidiformaceae bacterium]